MRPVGGVLPLSALPTLPTLNTTASHNMYINTVFYLSIYLSIYLPRNFIISSKSTVILALVRMHNLNCETKTLHGVQY